MMCWWRVWMLRRRRDQLEANVLWYRDTIYTYQGALVRTESQLRAAQADLWLAESPVNLLDPSRTASGANSSRG